MDPKVEMRFVAAFRGVAHRMRHVVRILIHIPLQSPLDADALAVLLRRAPLQAWFSLDRNAENDVAGQFVMDHGRSLVEPFGAIARVVTYRARMRGASLTLLFPGDVDLGRLNAFAFRRGTLVLSPSQHKELT